MGQPHVVTEAAAEAHPADRGEFLHAEGGMLSLEGAEGLADRRRHRAVLLDLGRREEAGHAPGREARHLAVEGAPRGTGLPRALAWGAPEEDDRADQLICALLGRVDQELELLPCVRRLDPLALSWRHGARPAVGAYGRCGVGVPPRAAYPRNSS